MNDKDSKVPVYIAILVALILVAAAAYYVLGNSSQVNPTNATGDVSAQTPTAKETPTDTGQDQLSTTTVQPTPTKVDVIKCELCHTNPQDLAPHVNGGKLCINCHGSQVHNIHIGAGTVNLQCDTCHGFPPTIPTVDKGEGPGHYAVCEKCHAAPPDSLKPSNGNLIVVHLSRGKYCTNCHGTDAAQIHAAVLGKAGNTSNASK